MAPNINNPGGVKNADDEIRDGVVSDATKFPGGNIDIAVSEAGAPIRFTGGFEVQNAGFVTRFDVSAQDGNPLGVTFNSDGSAMYIVGNSTSKLYQYSLSTAFDATTASFTSSFDVNPQASNPFGMTFNDDGLSVYVVDNSADSLVQYNLSTAFEITTASFDSSFDVSTQDDFPTAMTFRPDGSAMYVVGLSNEDVFQYSLSTGFDITTASFTSSFSVSTQELFPQGVAFNDSGSAMYVVGTDSATVFQYKLSTAFDVTSASLDSSFDVSTQDGNPEAVTFDPSGSLMTIVGSSSNATFQYRVGKVGPDLS